MKRMKPVFMLMEEKNLLRAMLQVTLWSRVNALCAHYRPQLIDVTVYVFVCDMTGQVHGHAWTHMSID